VALTFDNLGEAADLERGLWPADAPLGRHPSVTEALPRLLDELDALGLRATFFVEAINCELYADAVRGLAARGHEVAMHGWRHEPWDSLEPAREAELLARGVAAFAALGLRPRGFRPPGGALTPRSAALLGEHGFTWCSPEAGWTGPTGPLAAKPFAWPHVDAYWRLESFAGLRVRRGDPAEPLPWDDVAERLSDATGMRVLHPFLMIDEEGRAAASRILRTVAHHDRSPHA
jgi:peptidoglycan/xylan/chitin deacetylase (PgdA/CDA1 family)